MSFNQELIEKFVARVTADKLEYFEKEGGTCESNKRGAVAVYKVKSKYTYVDQGGSGRFMVVNDTGEIFGIKGYGVIHKGKRFGTLETIDDYFWGWYHPVKIVRTR